MSACTREEPRPPGADLPLAYSIFPAVDGLNRAGWGYEISLRGQPYIRQPHIPGIGGVRVFKSQEDAIKVAQRVIAHMRQGRGAYVSVKELVELGVIDLSGLYVEPYQQPSGTWGAKIMLDSLPVIGFDTFTGVDRGLPCKEDAIKAGNYIIQKMQRFQAPVMSVRELEQLGIG